MNRRNFIGASAAMLASASVKAAGVEYDMSHSGTNQGAKLKVRFLGTGAADWNGVDDRGEHRRLSSVLIDDNILIDFTNTAADMLPEGCHPEIIFYTHSHGDHCQPIDAVALGVKKVFLSHTWYDFAIQDFRGAAARLNKPMPTIIPTVIGQTIELGDITIMPLPANHPTGHIMEQSQLYLVTKGDARLLYATDTSGIPGVAARMAGIDTHVEGKGITALIIEATMGLGHENDYRIFCHNTVAEVQRIVGVLLETKRYLPADGQPVYLTHLARCVHGTQAELDATLPAPLKAAYDGLELLL